MIKTLRAKTALVTGASKRIGRAITLALGKEGVNTVIHYSTSADEANGLRDELIANKVKAWTVKADFTKPAEYETLIQRATVVAGNLDILINNASLFSTDHLDDMTLSGLMGQVEIHAWVPLILSREFASHRRGSIINLLDTRVTGCDLDHVSYFLSKQMLAALTKMMALEFSPSVTVNGIAPGLILPPSGEDEQFLLNLAGKIPLKRPGNPDDIAAAVVFLLKSDFITGQVLFVDGGRRLMEGVHGPHFDH